MTLCNCRSVQVHFQTQMTLLDKAFHHHPPIMLICPNDAKLLFYYRYHLLYFVIYCLFASFKDLRGVINKLENFCFNLLVS